MSWSRRTLLKAVAGASALTAGCGGRTANPTPSGDPTTPPSGATYAYTHQRPDGNRLLAGRGDVVGATPVEVPLEGTPAWLLAFAHESDTYWTVVTERGAATTHRVRGGETRRVGNHGTVAQPPVGYLADDTPAVVTPPQDAAAHTHPHVADQGLVYVAADGDVVLRQGETTTRADMAAPGDARPVALGDGRYVLYGAATDRYRHGALGDAVEGSSLVVVDPSAARVDVAVTLDSPAVFEGLFPLVADVDGDGKREVVTTVATPDDGARIRVYTPDGAELATGPVYGPGWRHQLCAAPFAPDGATELAVVRKPHVDRTLEYYRLTDGRLEIRATREGYASHTYGSRNVDQALGGDLDDDGRTELLVPTADRTSLAVVRRIPGGTAQAGSLPLGARLATNLVGVGVGNGIAVGAGTAEGVRVWTG
ncbi:hypothetical protein [Halobellus ruber]|uniref:VCBS repeat-containing protein n=1 Tax=Halobellus ruber TaxID=2761102 RepID=A0A7J9SJK4_9EURY|nr:hypothetical protein [Halobellus ruber]MBB6646898.1 hypothetical protein [Halobellus ruber]